MSKRFLLFEPDDVLIDFDEIVRIEALKSTQVHARKRNGDVEDLTAITLRHGGVVFVSLPFEEVLNKVRQVSTHDT